jgi:tRNA-(ms[2]io[6]A)-hydroxylase|tara:strand:- start:613 stop:1200 length:588 start_codon:yes stop_codon:yes gene_type:complete
VLSPWEDILACKTPQAWIDKALSSLEVLLLDHAHCEKKAATTAISLIHRYPDKNLARYLSPLAREELLHFEQVLKLIKKEGFNYRNLRSGTYAKELYEASSQNEPNRLKDSLLICALIEARSCERFSALLDFLPASLSKFYARLHEAESRHCDLYLNIYTEIFDEDWQDRLQPLSLIEASLIRRPDSLFRFHSGI